MAERASYRRSGEVFFRPVKLNTCAARVFRETIQGVRMAKVGADQAPTAAAASPSEGGNPASEHFK